MTRLTLVQQNDTLAHIEPHRELGWHDGRPTGWRAGGYGHLRALADAIRADAGGACVHVDSGDAIHGPGDLWQMIPTNPELFTLRLTGAQISRMLEQSLERSFAGDPLHQQGGYPMRFAGMHVVARVNNPAGARLQQVEIGDSPLNPAREDTVAAAGEQSVEEGSERVMQGIHAVDSVRAYFSVHIPDDHIATPTRFTAI